MCGILGWMTTKQSRININDYLNGINELFLLSETRGKEASGVCKITDDELRIIKAPFRAKRLIASKRYKECLATLSDCSQKLVMGHSRMVTNGDASNPANNQPILRGDLVCIHNGIIVNAEKLWKLHSELKRTSQVDTEIFLALMDRYDYQQDFFYAFHRVLQEIEGSLSIALADRKSDWLYLYTNTGSLYVAYPEDKSDIMFASERFIVERLLKRHNLRRKLSRHRIQKISPKTGIMINLQTGKVWKYSDAKDSNHILQGVANRDSSVRSISRREKDPGIYIIDAERKLIESLLQVDLNKIHAMRRCRKCLLPETFPGIKFDGKGVCNICNSYSPIKTEGENAFIRALESNHTNNSHYDCIVPVSGGRDSCYILHYLVKELHLRPVAYTYDWGLVTDLARRNIQRMCSALGVEHILISADISKKRENVRKNVEAWLKHPTLGTVPLFMAGDKQFFYYAQLLKRQMQVDNIIFGMNTLEETKFKARFAGLKTEKNNDSYSNFSIMNKFKLFADYGKEFILNPAYINASLLDSFTGFLSFYLLPQQYLRFFNYIPWDQNIIENTLINEYNWEMARDISETWRIGDGTAPFYNYIYYRMAGFTEFDTFKSNQIREGMLTREEALTSIDESNRVSVEGFLWYCQTIGLDPVRTLKTINKQKTLYEA